LKLLIVLAVLLLLPIYCHPQKNENNIPISQITLSNSIYFSDTSFTDLPGNGFLLDIGDEILAVTCKHSLWQNRPKEIKTINFLGKLNEWKMVVLNDTAQYVILGDLINENNNETIGERNTDFDYLIFKIKENHSKIIPLKLSSTHVKSGDTLYQVGWTYRTKKSEPQSFTTIAYGYSGSSLLINSLVRQNNAGLSGSPVINKNNELVAIVSSWKFDTEAQNWFEAPCSTDYLWKVLFSYWLDKNKKEKSLKTFREFISLYKVLNGNEVEVSPYLYTELFFTDWYKSKGFKCGSIDNFSQWTTTLIQTYGIKISEDNYKKSLLVFDSWKENYSSGKMEIKDLEQMLNKAKVSLPNFIDFCEYSQELTAKEKYDKAIDILLFADKKIQHMGQLYAFLGDVYLAKGEKELAYEAYLKCLQTYPEYFQAIDGLEKLKNR
jgi:tetratricopeptide (TPR) repeat protein